MGHEIDPDEVEKKLQEFVQSKFGDNIKVVTQKLDFDPLDPEQDERKTQEEIKPEELNLNFSYTPKEVYTYLNDFIIGQEAAKKTLSIAICDHYNHIRKESEKRSSISHYFKQNVLMLGPTGVGKTYMIKKLAQLVGVPFVKADATKFTEAGYVGANVEDTIRDLVAQADNNVKLAEYGIVYIDEADKLAGSRRVAGKDISGRGVQNGMLKLLEETEIDTKSPFDMMAQMNSMIMGEGKSKQPKTINTRNILFIFSGAFTGLEEIVKKRKNVGRIGLAKKAVNLKKEEQNFFSEVTTADLIEFGLEAELVGRLPVRVHLNHLSEDDLFKILKESKESILYQYIDAFDSYGIQIVFEDSGLRELAKMAYYEKTGARSLMTIFEKILRDFKFELPSIETKVLRVDDKLVNDPAMALKNIQLLNSDQN